MVKLNWGLRTWSKHALLWIIPGTPTFLILPWTNGKLWNISFGIFDSCIFGSIYIAVTRTFLFLFNAFQISVEILAHFVLLKADSPVTKHLEEKDLLSVSRWEFSPDFCAFSYSCSAKHPCSTISVPLFHVLLLLYPLPVPYPLFSFIYSNGEYEYYIKKIFIKDSPVQNK